MAASGTAVFARVSDAIGGVAGKWEWKNVIVSLKS